MHLFGEKRRERGEVVGRDLLLPSFFFEEVSALLKSKILLRNRKVDAKKRSGKLRNFFPFEEMKLDNELFERKKASHFKIK